MRLHPLYEFMKYLFITQVALPKSNMFLLWILIGFNRSINSFEQWALIELSIKLMVLLQSHCNNYNLFLKKTIELIWLFDY